MQALATMSWRARTLWAGVVIAVAVMLWSAGDRYYFAVVWPSKVQQETVGRVLADYGSLASRERSFAWGEGFARWRYHVDPANVRLRSFCGGNATRSCSFSRSRKVETGVTLYVDFADGVLTVEEWWS